MTTAEYKERHPENAHLEGDALWNAMEDELLRNSPCYQEDMTLSEEDEAEYQRALVIQAEAWAKHDVTSVNYTRRFWYDWDRIIPFKQPLQSAFYIVFDVSEEGSTKCWDIEGNEYPHMDALIEARNGKKA